MVRAEFPHVHILPSEVNLGFGQQPRARQSSGPIRRPA
jgi:hypothetical protein